MKSHIQFWKNQFCKGIDLLSNILYPSSMKQHGDVLIDIVYKFQSFVSTSQALSKFYGLKAQIKNIGLKLLLHVSIDIKLGRCNKTRIIQPMGLTVPHIHSEEDIDE